MSDPKFLYTKSRNLFQPKRFPAGAGKTPDIASKFTRHQSYYKPFLPCAKGKKMLPATFPLSDLPGWRGKSDIIRPLFREKNGRERFQRRFEAIGLGRGRNPASGAERTRHNDPDVVKSHEKKARSISYGEPLSRIN